MHRIVFLDRGIFPGELRRPRFDHRWSEWATTVPGPELDARLADATIVISSKIALNASILARFPAIRMIAVAGTGTDVFDLDYCRRTGIAVANVRHYARHSVPEHAIALMLAVRRNLMAYRDDVAAGRWSGAPVFCLLTHRLRDLHGARLGIVGAGVLGRAVAGLAAAFGMEVVFADYPGRSAHGGADRFVPFDELLATSDIVSLHCPLNDRTRKLIDARALGLMKRDGILINTARGGLIDEPALVDALRTGRIAGAGLDVLSAEPPVAGNPLLDYRAPNLLVTPHVAWASDGALAEAAEQLIENIELWVAGTPRHLVT
ncbi:MAG: D-2-hydroxyacid dehydrogenase [Burkholderiales bacterium]|nr:D-2-hydroxyacid dehydrogenase [Burkholderiales bacterium]